MTLFFCYFFALLPSDLEAVLACDMPMSSVSGNRR
jgi:hypothetical protein